MNWDQISYIIQNREFHQVANSKKEEKIQDTNYWGFEELCFALCSEHQETDLQVSGQCSGSMLTLLLKSSAARFAVLKAL